METKVLAVAVKYQTPSAVVVENGNGRDNDLGKQSDIQPIGNSVVVNEDTAQPVIDEKKNNGKK